MLHTRLSPQHRHEKADNSRVGSSDVLQDDHQPDQGWLGVREAECLGAVSLSFSVKISGLFTLFSTSRYNLALPPISPS